MDVTMKCGALAKELAFAANVVSRKATATNPVLASVLIDAEPMTMAVKLSATDLDLAVRSSCVAAIATPGRILIPAKRLHEMARLFPAETDLRVFADARGAVRVTCEKYDSRLAGFAVADFPALPAPNGETPSTLAAATLAALAAKVAFAVVEGDQRYYLAGARMELTPGSVRFVATDSHRLAIAAAARPDDGVEIAALVPGRALRELKPMFESGGDVAFALGEKHLFFSAGQRLLAATLAAGEFPKYDRIVPRPGVNDKRVVVNRERFALAIKRVQLATTETSRNVVFTIDGGAVLVSAASQEVGDASERVEAPYDGPKTTVRLNAQYVLDFLEAADGTEIAIEVKDDVSPVLLRQVDETATDYLNVVMPVAL